MLLRNCLFLIFNKKRLEPHTFKTLCKLDVITHVLTRCYHKCGYCNLLMDVKPHSPTCQRLIFCGSLTTRNKWVVLTGQSVNLVQKIFKLCFVQHQLKFTRTPICNVTHDCVQEPQVGMHAYLSIAILPLRRHFLLKHSRVVFHLHFLKTSWRNYYNHAFTY